MSKLKLEQCPDCGAGGPRIRKKMTRDEDGDVSQYQVYCVVCGHASAWSGSAEVSKQIWNYTGGLVKLVIRFLNAACALDSKLTPNKLMLKKELKGKEVIVEESDD